MSTGIIIIYYSLLIICVLIYLVNREKNNITLRDVIYALTFLTTSVGGVYCSYGFATLELCPLRPTVLACYILFFVLMTIAFVNAGKSKRYRFVNKLDCIISDRAIWIVYTFILIYTMAYFAFLGNNIPLINLIRTGDVSSAIYSRLEVTHDVTEHYNLPFIFRYSKFIRETPMFLLMCISYLKYVENRKYRRMFLIILFTTVFYQTFALEKAGVVYMIIMLAFCYLLFKQKMSVFTFNNILFFGLICLCLFGMYSFFMGQEENVFESISNRLFLRQTGWIYHQDEILHSKYGGCLYGGGITMFIIDSLFGRHPVALSQDVYLFVYSQYSKEGYVGTTGTMPMFYFYSNFGYIIGGFIFYYLAYVTAKVDNSFSNAVRSVSDNKMLIAAYATFLCLCIQGFMGNLSTVFMAPTFWSPQIIALILTVYYLKKLS